MSIYGNLLSNNIREFSLEEFTSEINSYQPYTPVLEGLFDLAFGENDNYNNIMNESGIILEGFSIKGVWEAIKNFINKIWNFIKSIPEKVKGLFSKSSIKKIKDDFNDFDDDDLFEDACNSFNNSKSEEEYEKEIQRLKEELEKVKQEAEKNKANYDKAKQDSEDSKKSSDRQNHLNMKRNELYVAKIHKAIAHIIDNDLLYYDPHFLLKTYILDCQNLKQTTLGNIENLEDMQKLIKRINNYPEEKYDRRAEQILKNLVQDEVLKLRGAEYGFKLGGYSHIDLNIYVKNKMAEYKQKNKIKDINKFINQSLTFIGSDTTHMEKLLIDIRDVIGILNTKISKVTPIDLTNDSYSRNRNSENPDKHYKHYGVDDKITKITLSKAQADVMKEIKTYISTLECACQVITVAIKYEGQYVGAVKSSIAALKALV